MTNPHFASPVAQLAADYSATADEYTRLWGPVILPMGLPLLDRLPLANARNLLDVGTGVGALIPHLTAKTKGTFICGIDRAEGMVRTAVLRHGAAFAVMDAADLAVKSASFDVVVLVFVLFHFLDPVAALRESCRALRTGGTIGVTTWAVDPGLPGSTIWTEVLDAAGAGPDPRAPSVRQHELMDSREKLGALLTDAGFAVREVWTRGFERRWDHDGLLNLQQACSGSGRRLGTLPAHKRATCVAEVRSRIGRVPVQELVWQPEVLFAVARRPG